MQFWDVTDLKEQKPKLELRGYHTDIIWDIAFDPSGKFIATADKGKNIRVFDPRENKLVVVSATQLAISSDLSYLQNRSSSLSKANAIRVFCSSIRGAC